MADLGGLTGKLVFISERDGESVCQEVIFEEDLKCGCIVSLNIPSPGDRDGICASTTCKILSVQPGQTPFVHIQRIIGGQQ